MRFLFAEILGGSFQNIPLSVYNPFLFGQAFIALNFRDHWIPNGNLSQKSILQILDSSLLLAGYKYEKKNPDNGWLVYSTSNCSIIKIGLVLLERPNYSFNLVAEIVWNGNSFYLMSFILNEEGNYLQSNSSSTNISLPLFLDSLVIFNSSSVNHAMKWNDLIVDMNSFYQSKKCLQRHEDMER